MRPLPPNSASAVTGNAGSVSRDLGCSSGDGIQRISSAAVGAAHPRIHQNLAGRGGHDGSTCKVTTETVCTRSACSLSGTGPCTSRSPCAKRDMGCKICPFQCLHGSTSCIMKDCEQVDTWQWFESSCWWNTCSPVRWNIRLPGFVRDKPVNVPVQLLSWRFTRFRASSNQLRKPQH